MIVFLWKGETVMASLIPDLGWIGPLDCPLDMFPDEQIAAERLGGIVVNFELISKEVKHVGGT